MNIRRSTNKYPRSSELRQEKQIVKPKFRVAQTDQRIFSVTHWPHLVQFYETVRPEKIGRTIFKICKGIKNIAHIDSYIVVVFRQHSWILCFNVDHKFVTDIAHFWTVRVTQESLLWHPSHCIYNLEYEEKANHLIKIDSLKWLCVANLDLELTVISQTVFVAPCLSISNFFQESARDVCSDFVAHNPHGSAKQPEKEFSCRKIKWN